MAFQVNQIVYSSKLSESAPKGITERIKAKIINAFFDRIKKNNPFIEAHIGKFRIKLPFSHQLPFLLRDFPYYSTNLARIARLVHQKYPTLTLIDIGANVGDSVALLRTEDTFPILCIEGDDYFFPILQENAGKFQDVEIIKTYVGEQNKQFNAVSIELGGTAHLSQDDLSNNIVYIERLSSILKERPRFTNSKMIKIDTDGFDNKIIRGSIDFLKIARPVVFFEYDPFFLSEQNDDGLSIFNTLFDIGYRKLLIYENNGEMLLSTDINNLTLLEDINNFYCGRKGTRYCDICAFHEEDIDLFTMIRKSEINFFKTVRT